MMDMLSLIQTAARPTIAKGTLFVVFGGLVVAGNAGGLWPLSLADASVTVSASVVAILGVGCLCHAGVEGIQAGLKARGQRMDALKAEEARTSVENARLVKEEAAALDNLDVLAEGELATLVWVLRHGAQRFHSYRRSERFILGLHNKGILVRPAEYRGTDVWVVRDSIWSAREDLLRRHRGVRTGSEMPGVGWMAA